MDTILFMPYPRFLVQFGTNAINSGQKNELYKIGTRAENSGLSREIRDVWSPYNKEYLSKYFLLNVYKG